MFKMNIYHFRNHRRRRFIAVRIRIEKFVECSTFPINYARWCKFPAFTKQKCIGFISKKLNFINGTAPPSISPRATTIGAQRPLGKTHRIGSFKNLERRNGRSRNRCVTVIKTIAEGMSAMTPAKKREHYPTGTVFSVTR